MHKNAHHRSLAVTRFATKVSTKLQANYSKIWH